MDSFVKTSVDVELRKEAELYMERRRKEVTERVLQDKLKEFDEKTKVVEVYKQREELVYQEPIIEKCKELSESEVKQKVRDFAYFCGKCKYDKDYQIKRSQKHKEIFDVDLDMMKKIVSAKHTHPVCCDILSGMIKRKEFELEEKKKQKLKDYDIEITIETLHTLSGKEAMQSISDITCKYKIDQMSFIDSLPSDVKKKLHYDWKDIVLLDQGIATSRKYQLDTLKCFSRCGALVGLRSGDGCTYSYYKYAISVEYVEDERHITIDVDIIPSGQWSRHEYPEYKCIDFTCVFKDKDVKFGLVRKYKSKYTFVVDKSYRYIEFCDQTLKFY